MKPNTNTLEEIHTTLMYLRQKGATRFPKELWDAIIRLTQIYSIKEICLHLNINSSYLKRKIQQSGEPLQLDFQEVSQHLQNTPANNIVIELSSSSGLKAKIQGPLTCLNFLHSLFGG